jgi:hypothetical protein
MTSDYGCYNNSTQVNVENVNGWTFLCPTMAAVLLDYLGCCGGTSFEPKCCDSTGYSGDYGSDFDCEFPSRWMEIFLKNKRSKR